MENEKVFALLEKYHQGLCTQEESAIVEAWYNAYAAEHSTEAIAEDMEGEKSIIWENIQENKNPVKTARLNYNKWIAIAATIVVVCTTNLLFFINKPKNGIPTAAVNSDIIKPGKNSATLTLANGKKILLSDVTNGVLAEEAGVVISKTADGKLIYEIQHQPGVANNINTISTDKGETYQLRLPDGTNVWLNAASSLIYATTLIKDGVRKVKLEGEAYFEVAKDKKHPFIVETKQQRVEVLGTHFNVSAYADDKTVKTTLLHGAVKVTAHGQTKLLKPKQQATFNHSNINVSNGVDLEEVMAWKNGDFKFDDNLESIMTKIARWYDVEVVYQMKPNADLTFSGKISRSRNISGILKMLSYNDDVHFKVEGRRITVTQ